MIDLEEILEDIIIPGLEILPEKFYSPEALAMLLAIGQQESRFTHRRQIAGPARGFFQFELGGVRGVLSHPSSKKYAKAVLEELQVSAEPKDILAELENNDNLAVAFARLLLWTDSESLPEAEEENADIAWEYYLRNWRPGRPHEETWESFWTKSCEVVANL